MGSIVLSLLACVGPDAAATDKGRNDVTAAAFDLPEDCSSLSAPPGETVTLGPDDDVAAAVAAAESGTTLLLEDGTYDLSGGDAADNLAFHADGVTLRSASGDASAVILDAFAATTEIISIEASDIVIAEITVQRSYGAAIDVLGSANARIYGVDVVDPGGVAINVGSVRGAYSDDGIVACSTLTRPGGSCAAGIEAMQAANWRVYGNVVTQGSCIDSGIRFWTGSRDTVIERNQVSGGRVGISVGDVEYGEGEERVYDDAPCPELGQAGHYGGIVRNNFVWASGLDGIRIEDSCDTVVAHNSIASAPLEWQLGQDLSVWNNLATIASSDGANVDGNREPADSDFMDMASGDLHLVAGSAAIDAGIVLVAGVSDDDIDRDARDGSPDVGADEFGL